MSIEVVVVDTIDCTCEELLRFVMDIERYAQVDDKISPVLWRRRDGNVVRFACRPKLVGIRQPKVVQRMQLTPGRRVDIELEPKPANRLAHAIAAFSASFVCREAGAGIEVTRTLRFDFRPISRSVLEPLFRRRLEPEVVAEIRRAKHYLEHGKHGR